MRGIREMNMKKWTIRVFSYVTIGAIIFLNWASYSNAAVWHVDSTVSTPGSGISWIDAFSTVQDALSSENILDGDEIWIKTGTYPLSSELNIDKTIALYGGFNGTETERQQRDWNLNTTTLDGQDAVDHCLNISADCTIDGFTITGGYSDGGGTAYFGGGLIALDSAPTISNCIFIDNYSEMGGAGLDTWNSSPTIINCTFLRNVSSAGGAIRFRDSDVTIDNCLFENNTATGDNPKSAGIYAWDTTCLITNTNFINNTGVNGGGFMCNNGSATLTNCTFSENYASNGGAVYNNYGVLVIDQCLFDMNTSGWNGGAIYNCNGAMTVTKSIFSGNNGRSGGGIYNSAETLTLTNNVFVSNNAGYYGGGVFSIDNAPIITNCTFFQNAAERAGGGVNFNAASPVLTNCILWGDTAGEQSPEINDYEGSSNITAVFCDIDQNGFEGSDNNIRIDPLFVDPINNDLHLQQLSPCIDAGTDVSAPASDIDDIIRPQGAGHDIGAYEWMNDGPPTVISVTGSEYSVVIQLSKQVSALTAENISNYTINNISVYDAEIDATLTRITLTTSIHTEGTYSLIMTNLQDLSGNTATELTATYSVDLVDLTPPSSPQNLQAAATSNTEINLSWAASVDNTAVAEYRIYRDSVNIGTSLITSFQDNGLNPMTEYTYSVSAVDAAGNESQQSSAVSATTLNVEDLTPPVIVSISATDSAVMIEFSESLNSISAENPLNYSISNGLAITGISLADDHCTVTLQTSAHTDGTYTIAITGIEDLSGNVMSETTSEYTYARDDAGSTPNDASGTDEDESSCFIHFITFK